MAVPIEKMSDADVAFWFETIKLFDVAKFTLKEGIDGETIVGFNSENFEEIGVPKNGFKRKQFDIKFEKLKTNGFLKKNREQNLEYFASENSSERQNDSQENKDFMEKVDDADARLIKSNRSDLPDEITEDLSDNDQNASSTREVIFQPGLIGITYNGNIVIKVIPDSQAEKANIGVGWCILKVNGERQPNDNNAIGEAVEKAKSVGQPFAILFKPCKNCAEESSKNEKMLKLINSGTNHGKRSQKKKKNEKSYYPKWESKKTKFQENYDESILDEISVQYFHWNRNVQKNELIPFLQIFLTHFTTPLLILVVDYCEVIDGLIYTVQFTANNEDPWGCKIDFNSRWDNWYVYQLEPEQQASRAGIQLYDKIIGIDDLELNETTYKVSEKKLRKGCACIISFKQGIFYQEKQLVEIKCDRINWRVARIIVVNEDDKYYHCDWRTGGIKIHFGDANTQIRRLEFSKLANKFRGKNNPKALFLYFQHHVHELNEKYSTLKIADKSLKAERKGFPIFLEKNYRKGVIDEYTSWSEVDKLWKQKHMANIVEVDELWQQKQTSKIVSNQHTPLVAKKKTLCTFFKQGRCRYGNSCHFSHVNINSRVENTYSVRNDLVEKLFNGSKQIGVAVVKKTVVRVTPGSQAEMLGVRIGWKVISTKNLKRKNQILFKFQRKKNNTGGTISSLPHCNIHKKKQVPTINRKIHKIGRNKKSIIPEYEKDVHKREINNEKDGSCRERRNKKRKITEVIRSSKNYNNREKEKKEPIRNLYRDNKPGKIRIKNNESRKIRKEYFARTNDGRDKRMKYEEQKNTNEEKRYNKSRKENHRRSRREDKISEKDIWRRKDNFKPKEYITGDKNQERRKQRDRNEEYQKKKIQEQEIYKERKKSEDKKKK